MLANLQRHKRFFIAFTILAFAVRWLFIRHYHMVAGDGLIYGEIALNLLRNGVYGLTGSNGAVPTLIRLPGYPAFLAAVFSIFGQENYTAVMYVQMFFDVGTCFIVADLARRAAGEHASRLAFVLAALCPLTVNYVATALTESLTLFFTALAFDFAMAAFQRQDSDSTPPPQLWIGCGLAIAGCILLRPDGGFVLISIGLVILWRLLRHGKRRATFAAGLLVAVFALAPLVPWTIRNWRVFHAVQPLAPYSASDPGEEVRNGFRRWTTTWIVDYSSLEDLVFNVPGDTADVTLLPSRAFDSAEERLLTQNLFQKYAADGNSLGPELDAEFGKLADDRIARHPLRAHVWLPLLRMLDMWFRPQTEFLPVDIHWWRFDEDVSDSVATVTLGLLNLLLVGAAIAGLFAKPRMRTVAALLLYISLTNCVPDCCWNH